MWKEGRSGWPKQADSAWVSEHSELVGAWGPHHCFLFVYVLTCSMMAKLKEAAFFWNDSNQPPHLRSPPTSPRGSLSPLLAAFPFSLILNYLQRATATSPPYRGALKSFHFKKTSLESTWGQELSTAGGLFPAAQCPVALTVTSGARCHLISSGTLPGNPKLLPLIQF
jgi:hypothetical protein